MGVREGERQSYGESQKKKRYGGREQKRQSYGENPRKRECECERGRNW